MMSRYLTRRFGFIPVIVLFISSFAIQPASASVDVGVTRSWFAYWTSDYTSTTARLIWFQADLAWDGSARVAISLRDGSDCFASGDTRELAGLTVERGLTLCRTQVTVRDVLATVPAGQFHQIDFSSWRISGSAGDISYDLTFSPGTVIEHTSIGSTLLCPNGAPVGGPAAVLIPQDVGGTLETYAVGTSYEADASLQPFVCFG